MIDSQNEMTLSRAQASLLVMMGNPTRLTILKLLLVNEFCVQDLAGKVGLTENATSMHLAKLRRGKIVTTNRQSQNIYYSLNRKSPAVKVLAALNAIASD